MKSLLSVSYMPVITLLGGELLDQDLMKQQSDLLIGELLSGC